MGVGFPRAGHRRLTALLAFTVTSSTSSCVSPRITGGAGWEGRARSASGIGLEVNMVEMRKTLGTRCLPGSLCPPHYISQAAWKQLRILGFGEVIVCSKSHSEKVTVLDFKATFAWLQTPSLQSYYRPSEHGGIEPPTPQGPSEGGLSGTRASLSLLAGATHSAPGAGSAASPRPPHWKPCMSTCPRPLPAPGTAAGFGLLQGHRTGRGLSSGTRALTPEQGSRFSSGGPKSPSSLASSGK